MIWCIPVPRINHIARINRTKAKIIDAGRRLTGLMIYAGLVGHLGPGAGSGVAAARAA